MTGAALSFGRLRNDRRHAEGSSGLAGPRNSCATSTPQFAIQELRVSVTDSGPPPLDIFAPELVTDPDVYRRWIITLPGRYPFVVIVVPAANAAQMTAMYPTAMRVHPEPEGTDE